MWRVIRCRRTPILHVGDENGNSRRPIPYQSERVWRRFSKWIRCTVLFSMEVIFWGSHTRLLGGWSIRRTENVRRRSEKEWVLQENCEERKSRDRSVISCEV